MSSPEMKAMIARFMELKEASKVGGLRFLCKDGYWRLPDTMPYDTSWDWLMPVCYKIKTHQIPEIDDTDEINEAIMALWKDIATAVACINIKIVFNACVNYISWCNCQLKPIEQNTASNSIEKSIELGELKGGGDE